MAFFTSAIATLQTLVVALGAGLGVWGAINLLEGYGNDNPGANVQKAHTNNSTFPGRQPPPLFQNRPKRRERHAALWAVYMQIKCVIAS